MAHALYTTDSCASAHRSRPGGVRRAVVRLSRVRKVPSGGLALTVGSQVEALSSGKRVAATAPLTDDDRGRHDLARVLAALGSAHVRPVEIAHRDDGRARLGVESVALGFEPVDLARDRVARLSERRARDVALGRQKFLHLREPSGKLVLDPLALAGDALGPPGGGAQVLRASGPRDDGGLYRLVHGLGLDADALARLQHAERLVSVRATVIRDRRRAVDLLTAAVARTVKRAGKLIPALVATEQRTGPVGVGVARHATRRATRIEQRAHLAPEREVHRRIGENGKVVVGVDQASRRRALKRRADHLLVYLTAERVSHRHIPERALGGERCRQRLLTVGTWQDRVGDPGQHRGGALVGDPVATVVVGGTWVAQAERRGTAERPAQVAVRADNGLAVARAFDDQVPLKLGDGGEHVKEQAAGRGAGVDRLIDNAKRDLVRVQ